MRSLLFLAANDSKKMEKAFASAADALILDLEDAVADHEKDNAREFLRQTLPSFANKKPFFVRINGLTTPYCLKDISTAVEVGAFGVCVPKSEGHETLNKVSAALAVAEAEFGKDTQTKILCIATETPKGVFSLNDYQGFERLYGLTWGGEDLSAAVGAETNRDDEGQYTAPYQLARSLTLFGAAHAGVKAIDGVYTHFKNMEGLEQETKAAVRDGFVGKMAIHPIQIDLINALFTPSKQKVDWAKAVQAKREAEGFPAVLSFEGRMLDKPHFLNVENTLERAKRYGVA